MCSLLPFNANPLPFLYVIPTSTDPLRSSRILLRPTNTMPDFQIETPLNLVNRIFSTFLTCTFTLGLFLHSSFFPNPISRSDSEISLMKLSLIGIITGAIKGQTMKTKLVRGASVVAVTGAITSIGHSSHTNVTNKVD